MIDRAVIQKILTSAAMAPSGSNSQPWKFRIHGDVVDIFNTHHLDHPFLNFRWRGTYVAHGAVIENMLLQSASLGYTGTVALFPDPNNHDLIARISFLKSTPAPDSLVPYIDKRHTNRKKYKNQPLTDNQRTELSMISGVVLLEDRKKIKSLGPALSITERVALETPEIHHEFF